MRPVIASRSQRSHASCVAASRTSARTGTRAPAAALPKALTCALMALSVIASSLLAVALTIAVPEPTPAAAQLTGIAATTTTEINIDLKGDDKLTTHSDFGITHTVTASNCDAASGGQSAIVDTGQSNTTANSSLAEENNTSNQIYRHHIDYRCDWTITFTSADKCGVMVLPRGLSGAPIANGTARTGYAAVNTITLHKNPDYPTAIATGGGNNSIRENRRLVADTDDQDNTTVHTLEVSKCVTVVDVEQITTLARVDGESLENSLTTQTPAELGIAGYTIKPTDCLAGIAPSGQTMASRVLHPTNDKVFRHILDVRCDWDVRFTGPADHCVMAEPTRRYIRQNQWYPEWDLPGGRVTVPFRLESDPVGPSGGGFSSFDPRYRVPRLTFQGSNANVINLEVLPEANEQCISSLEVFGVNGETGGTVRVVMESVQDASARPLEPCETNAASQRLSLSNVEEHYAQTFSSRFRHGPLVGRNCDWVVSFTPRFNAGRDNHCHFRARLLNENGNLVRTRVRADHDYDSVYELYAAPGETVTIPFFGEDSRMRFTTWQQTSGSDTLEPVHHSISQVELTGCVVPPGSARLPIFDKAGDGFDLFYEIKPVACAGISLPPSQNLDHWINSSFYERKTAPTDGTNPVDITYPAGFSGADFVQDQTHLLIYYCDWEVSFQAAPIGMTPATKTNCEVKVWVWRSGAGTTAADAVYDTDGVVLLEGVPPVGQNPDGTFRYDSATSTSGVLGLYVTVDDSAGKCASGIAVNNTVSNTAAAGASATVEVSATPDPMACTPHSRGPKPDGNIFLQGGESSMLTLAHNCAWKLAFSASNKNCVASAQLKDAAGENIDTAMTTSFATPEKTITLAKTDAGLTHTYTPTGGSATTTVVAAIEFDGCVADSTPADTAKITVIDTTPSYGSSYQFTSSSCTGGASPTSPITNADAITSVDAETGNLVYVQYLNYNCNWEVSVISSDVCPVPFTIENAADPPAVVATVTGLGQNLTKDSDNSRFLIGTDTSKVVATIKLGVDPTDSTCHLKLDFVNRSVPLAVAEGHAFRNEADQLIAPASGRPQNPRGQYTALDDQVPAADYQFPQVLLNFTPLDDTGAACTASNGTKPTEPVSIDAMSIKTTSEGNKLNKPVLDADGNYILTPNSETYQLDKTCNWLVEFVSVVSAPSELECFSAARVLGRDGQQLGTAALGSPYDGDLLQDVNNTPNDRSDDMAADGPFNGGSFMLQSNANGLTYAGQEVASVEFLGCLDVDYPGTSVLQILDDTGLDGEFSYTITPALSDPNNPSSDVLCEAADLVANPPAAQSSANALVLSGVSNLHQHYLSYDCAWDVTFTGKPACQDSVTVWRDASDGLVFADAVTDTHEQGVLRVRLAPRNRSLLVSDPSAKHPDRNTNQNVSEELIPSLGYYIGSGGGQQLAADALSGGGSSGTGGGSAGLPGGPAAGELDFVVSPALSLECASEIEVASRSGLEGPGLELAVTSPGVAATATAASACTTNQDRLPGFNRLEAAESFSLALNRRCSWNITFKSRAETCSAAVRILDTATPPALIDTLWTIPGQSATIALPANVAGLQYTPASGPSAGTATAVGTLEFYNCFYPSVSLAATDIPADTQLTVSFAVIGTQPGCTTAASQVVLTNDPSASNAQRIQSSIEGRGFKFRIQGERALLNSLAGDGSLCEYDVRVTGPAEVGQLVSLGDALTARTSYVALERPRAAVTLRNLTSAATSGLAPARQNVIVAVTPRAGCPQGAPNASPYTLAPASFEGDRATLQLGAAACVWDISYRTANSDCLVAAQFKDRTGNNIGEANASGSLVVTSRVGTSQPTQLGSIEFTVLSCFSTFEASLSVSVTDLQAGANHAGEVVTATIAPTQSAPVGCSPSQTLRLTLDASNRASVRTTLAKVPEGTGTNCSYQVSFADTVVTAAGVLLTRTSPATAALNAPPALASPAAIAATTHITASYQASRPAVVQLTNTTLFSSTHSPAARRDVLVTITPVTSQSCTDEAPPNSPHTVHAASNIQAVLGTQACAWTISYQVPANDCIVSAQIKQPDGTDIGSPDTDGELTIYVDANRQVRSAASGGTRIGSLEFTVTSNSDCTTYFNASLALSVPAAAAGAHKGAPVIATVSPASTAHDDCTDALEAVRLELGDDNTASATWPGLVDVPAGETTSCSYELAFAPDTSKRFSDITISSSNTNPASLSAAAPDVAVTYAVSMKARVEIQSTEYNPRTGGYYSPTEMGHNFTFAPVANSCGQGVTEPPAQSNADGHVLFERFTTTVEHYLDYRCDWEATHSYTGLCQHQLTYRSGIDTGSIPSSPFTLTKARMNERQLRFGFASNLTAETIGVGMGDQYRECAKELLVAAKDSTVDLKSLEGQDVTYEMTTNGNLNCLDFDGEPASWGTGTLRRDDVIRRNVPNPVAGTFNYQHRLDYRCDFQVLFDAPPVANKCLAVEIGYLADGATDPVIYATRGPQFGLNRNYGALNSVGLADGQVVYGDPALNQPVNRLLVSYVDDTDGNGNRQCASLVRFQNYIKQGDVNIRHSDINLSLATETGAAKQVCTPNEASATVAEANANALITNGVLGQNTSHTVGLGHNCDWLVTFGAIQPECAVTATFYNGDTQITTTKRIDPKKPASDSGNSRTIPYEVSAAAGETVTFRVQGEDSRLKIKVGEEKADHTVTRVEFDTCSQLDGQTSIRMVDRTPDEVEVSYEFVPVRCVGAGLPPSQDASDAATTSRRIYEDDPDSTTDRLIRQRGDFQHLSYFCDWQVSFDAPGNCVTIKAHLLEAGQLDSRINGRSAATIRSNSFTLHTPYNHPTKAPHPWLLYQNSVGQPVHELEYSVTDPDECSQLVGQRIPLRNISDLAGIGAVNLNFALTDDTCMPNTGEAPSEFVLGPQETRDIYLARNCDWTITHSSASAEFCTSWLSAYDTTGFLSNEFSSLNLVKDDSDLTQDLKESTLEFVPGEFRVNGCRNRYSQNPGFNGAKVVVLDRTAPVNVSYAFVKDGACENGVTAHDDLVTNEDVTVVVGEQRIHYLEYGCDWIVSATDDNYAVCDFNIQFKESVEAEPYATVISGQETDMRIMKRDVAGKRFVHSGDETKQVGALVITPAAGCVLPIEFVNRSEPYLANNQGDWLYPRGTQQSPARNLPELELPFPRVALNFTPLTAAGEACAVDLSLVVKPRGVVTLDAMGFEQNSRNEPELDEQGNLMFTPDSENYQLDPACNWLVEFVGVTVAGAPWACVARAQILGMNGERLGNPVGAGAFEGQLKMPRNDAGAEDPAGTDFGPFGGGSFVLQAGPSGVTYQGKLVGSVEFEGCLPTGLAESSSCVQEVQPADPDTQIDEGNIDGTVLRCDPQGFPEVAELHIYDAVSPVGDLEFSVRPAVLGGAVQCDGTGQPPAALDHTDGLVFGEAPGSLVYFLSTRCDWVVTFERSAVCDAVSVWGLDSFGEKVGDIYSSYDIPVFVDTVTSDVLSVRLLRSAVVTLDGQPPRAEDSAEVPGGLVYFPGSGGGVRLASDALRNVGGGDGSGAVAGGPQRVAGLAFECAPQVELSSVSGAAGPGLAVTVQPKEPPAAPDSGLDSVSPVCSDPQRHQRYPAGVRSAAAGVGAFGGESADELPDEDAILPGESFRVALNQDCTWEIEFESRDANCVVAARVLAADGSLLGEVERTTAGSPKTLTLTAGSAGLTYPPATSDDGAGGGAGGGASGGASGGAGATPGIVAAIEFYDCFTPQVSLAAVPGVAWATPGVPDGTEFTVTFWPVAGKAGCSAGKSQTMVAGQRGLSNKAQGRAAGLFQAVYTRVKDTPARLVGLADDGSVCEYELEVAGLSSVGQIGYRGRVSPRSGWAPLRSLAPSLSSNTLTAASLSFANDTSASSSGHTAAQRQVLVTLTPANSCSGAAAEPVGPFALGVALSATSDRTVLLGSQDCVWTVSYQNTADDCAVTVALLDSDNAPASAAFTDTSDRSFELSVRAKVADSKPAASAKFEVGACYEEFEATIEVSVTDEVGVPGHAGTPVTVTVAPVADSNPICSSPFTVQLVLNAAGRASTTRTLARRPMGQSAAECNYEVQLPDSQLSPVGALMPASATPPRLSAAAASVTAELEAMRPAAVALRNATPLTTPYTHASQLNVVVTLEPAADCTDRLLGASPYTIVAGSAPARGVMSTANCEWQLSATNPAADCAVTLQLRGANDAAVGSLDLDGGTVSLFVVSGQVRTAASGGELVAAADFAVTRDCSSYFTGVAAVSVRDLLADEHADDYSGAVVAVQVSQRSPARPQCHFGTGATEVAVRLGAANPATGSVFNLVGVPLGTGAAAAKCEYVALFPPTVSLPGSVRLQRQGEAAALFSVTSPEAAKTYEVVRPRQLLLRNTTPATSGHAFASERTVELEVSRADLCLEGERTYLVELAAESERLVLLDPGDCSWGILWQNPAGNCVVESRFKGSAGGVLGDADIDGRQSFHVGGSRIFNAPLNSPSPGDPIDVIEYKVRDTGCRAEFEATLSVSVTDAANGDHAGSEIEVTVAPKTTPAQHADCSASQTVTLTLGPPAPGSSAANEATKKVRLLHNPPGETAVCEYEATFPAAPTTTGNVTLNRTSDASVDLTQVSPTAAGAYTAAYSTLASGNSTTVTVRNANGTTFSLAGLNVSYALTPDCPGAVTPVPSTQHFGNATPDSNAANVGVVTHALDHRCDWTASFAHAGNCVVSITVSDGATTRATALSVPSVTFTKPANPSSSTKFTYNNMTADTFRISVDQLVGECHTEVLVGDATGMHALNPLPTREQGEARTISYTLAAGDCIDKRGNPSPSHRESQSRPANPVMGTVNYQHSLEYRCDWNVAFSHPAHQNCLQVELAYEDEAGEVTVHAKRGLRFSLTKDPANNRLVYGAAADALVVNRLLVSFVEAVDADGNRVCASAVSFEPTAADPAVKVSVKAVQPGSPKVPGGRPQACTPNSASSSVAEVNAALASFSADQTVALGRNCDWLVTFGSADSDCAVTATVLPAGAQPETFEARAGRTATVRLLGGADRLSVGVLHKGRLVHLRVTGLEFASCGITEQETAIELKQLSGSATGIEVKYDFVPVACNGTLPEAQNQDDTVTVGSQSFQYLAWACSWDVRFYTDSNCEVKVDVFVVNTGKRAPQAVNALHLARSSDPVADSYGSHRYVRYNLAAGGHREVTKLEYAAATGTNNDECSDEIELTNIAATGAGRAVKVTWTPNPGCSPPAREPGPAPFEIAGQETVTVSLSLKCHWQIKVEPVSKNSCAASIQVKDTAATPANLGTKVTTTIGQFNFNDEISFSKAAGGFQYDPPGNDPAATVGLVELDGCAETPGNTAAVTVQLETGLLDIQYDLEVATGQNSCESTVTTRPSNQDEADAVISGADRVHYLDYRCNWLVTAADQQLDACVLSVDFKETAAADAAVQHTVPNISRPLSASERLLTRSGTKFVYSEQAGNKDVAALVIKPGAGCVLPLRLANVSTPLGYHFSRTGPDAEWNFLPGLRPSPGMASTNRDNVVEFERQFPEVTLDILPHTAGAACTPSAGYVPDLTNDVVLPAGQVDDDGAKLNFTNGSQVLTLDPACDWRIGFLSGIKADVAFLTGQPDLVCYASVQVRDRSGVALGSPVAGAPALGGYVDLAAGSEGVTYPAADGTATLVGSIDFEGCVPLQHPGASEVMIYDDSGSAGDFTYTVMPAQRPKPQTAEQRAAGAAVEYETTCEGFEPPDAQSQAAGLLFSGAPGARLHHLNNSCDWVVEFTGAAECEAAMLWQFGETGLRFVDAVWGTPAAPGSPGSGKVTLRLTQYHGDQLDHSQLGRGPPGLPADDPATSDVDERKLAREDRAAAAALESGLGFFVGSGSDMSEGGVRHTSEVRPAMLPAGVGAASISDLTGAQPVNAVSLECVSGVDFTSAASGPGLEVTAASPAETAPDPATDQVIVPGGCVALELRPSVAGLATASMPLLRGCDWTVSFKSSAPACQAAAEVLGADKTTLLERVFQTSSAAVEIELGKDAGGLQFTPSGAGATASVVGEIKFYDCFQPNVTLRVPTAVVGERITVGFAAVAGQTGCTQLASQVMEFGAAPLGAGAAGVQGAPAALVSLAADGTLCRYEVTAASANSLLGELSAASVLTAAANAVVIAEFPQVELTLRNATAADSSGHSAVQRMVLVTIEPKSGSCSAPAPAGSPFNLGAAGSALASRVVQLRAANCVWTVKYRNTAEDCTVEARLKDTDGALVSGTTADDDGSLEITTRNRAADSTPVSALEFTVGTCTAPDTTGPEVESISLNTSSITVNGTATVTIGLSKSPKAGTFDASDVVVAETSGSGVVDKGALVAGANNTYTLVLTGKAAGTVSISIAAGSFTDAADNPNTVTASAVTLTVTAAADTTGPVVTGLSVSPASIDIGSTATVTVRLSEAPDAATFDASDVRVAETSGSGVVSKGALVAGANNVYTMVLTGAAAGSVSIEVAAGSFTDAAGNPNTVTASAATLTVSAVADTTGPVVESVSVSSASIDIGSTATVTVRLSEAPDAATFDASDVRVAETSGSGVVSKGALVAGANNVYTMVLTGAAAGSVSIEVAAGSFRDAAGNPNTVTASAATLTVSAVADTTGPVVESVSVSPASVSVDGVATVTIDLSEVPKAGTLDASDVVVTETSGSGVVDKGTLSGSGTRYTLALTGKAAGTVSISIAAGSFTDAADNPNTVTASAVTLTVTAAADTTGPVVTGLSVSPASVSVDGVATVTIDLSEAPKAGTFDASDVVVAETSGSGVVDKGALSGSGTRYTLALTGKAAGTVSISIAAGSFTDAADNPNTVTASAVTLMVTAAADTTGPVVTGLSVSPASVSVDGVATVTIDLSEAPKAGTLDASDVVVTETSGSGVVDKGALSGSGTRYTLALTGKAAGSVSISIAAGSFTDAADNPNTVTASAVTLTVTAAADTTGPAVISVSVSPASITVGGTATVNIRLSEAPAAGTFTAADVSVLPSGVVSKGVLQGSGTSYTLSLRGVAAGSVSVSVAAGGFTDAAGNPNTVTASPAALTVTAVPTTTPPPVSVPPPTPGVSVSPASPVTEGGTLRFGVSLPGPAAQQVVVSYTTSLGGSGSVMIAAGQSAAVIEVPTTDDELDGADQTVRVTLTGATGPVAVASLGRTATGVVRDDDPAPLVGLGGAVIDGNRLRFKVVLLERSGRDVKVSYASPAGSGTAVISAGELDTEATQVFDRALLASGGSLRLRLISAQNASIDPVARERVVTPGGSWQFYTVSREGGVRASQLVQALGLGEAWRLFSWNTAGQRWVEHSSVTNRNTVLPAGAAVTYRGSEPTQTELATAGLGLPASITLAQGWNIFKPDSAAYGYTRSDFTRTRDDVPAVIFDPLLIDCDNLAGLLVIYTFDQNDPRSQNGFRLTLPCHPELQDQLGIPAIETIDQNDTIYAWFNSTTPVSITFQDGQYTPAT